MKKLLLLCLVLLGGVMQASAAVSGTIYFAINTDYTMKLWVRYGTYSSDPEDVITMTKTDKTYDGLTIYSASFSKNDRDGISTLAFQAFDGSTWKWTDYVINQTWTTDLTPYNGKLKKASNSTLYSYDYDKPTEVYLCNDLEWSNPYVYIFRENKWEDNYGAGASGYTGVAMSQIGTTNIWKAEPIYPVSGTTYIAFTAGDESNYGHFYNTSAIYKNDFSTNKSLFVPNTTSSGTYNENCIYFNNGTWHPFPTYTRTVTSGNYGTICLPFNATVAGADIFIISSKVMDKNDNTKVKYINFTPVQGNTMEAGKAYIFKATSSTLTATLSGNYSDAIAANGMMGNISSTSAIAVSSGNLIIKNNMLYEVGTGVTCGQYKGYITPSTINVASARGANFMGFEDETTGIANLNVNDNDNLDTNAPMYNLAGQRVNKSYKGVVIVNGKKMLNK